MPKKRKIRDYTPLGETIAEATGLTQAKLAKKWGVSQQTTSKRLRGESAISVKDLKRLSKKCKLYVGVFIGTYEVAL